MLFGLPVLPLAAAGVAAAIVAAPAGWIARGLIFDLIEKPALIEHQKELCAAEVEAAAAAATLNERNRQAQIGESLWREAERKRIEDEAEHEAQTAMLREEIAAYETEKTVEGRSCPLTQRDLDFLAGVRLDLG